jgi:hypothetical protein
MTLSALLLAAPLGGAVWAAPTEAVAGGACHRVYLPLLVSVSGGAASATQANAPAAASRPCAVFPDFNGDGYADLAIGVPNKEVSNGVTDQVDVGLVHVIYGSAGGLDAGAGQPGPDDQIWHRALAAVSADPGDNYGAALAMGDFNRDGYDDLAIGIPGANIAGHDDAGAVHVIYGGANGLELFSIVEFARGSNGLLGPSAAGERFGTSLTAGDFDGDGYADLAVGTPFATVGGDVEAGGVQVLYGRGAGLSSLGNEWLTQDTSGFVASPAEPYDRFGLALAAGDFDGDGVDDLAVGTPGENNGDDFIDAGAVQIFFGQKFIADPGLIHFGAVTVPQHWTADSPNVDGLMEPEDGFGYALAAGDFDADGYADLAVGIPFEVHGSGPGALLNGGAINVLSGSPTGLAATPAKPGRLWHQDVSGMADEVEAGEFFGYALSTGDFDGDGYADLAIGVPGNRLLGINIGAAHLMYGAAAGLSATGDTLLYDPANPAAGDAFGWTLAAADYNGDGRADLAVGAYRDDPVGVAGSDTGSVFTFYSNAAGLQESLNQNWYPGHFGLKGAPATGDNFGAALPGSPNKP